MKNFFYLPLLAMMTLVFTSCSETEDILPDSTTVEITATGTPTGVITPGTQISVALKLRSSDNSLKGLVMSGPGVEHTYEDIANTDKDEMPKEGLRSGDEYVYTNSKQIDYVMNHTVSQDEFEAAQETGKMVYEFILSDKNGQKTTSVEFEVSPDETPLVEDDFAFVRVGTNNPDLSEYGLVWESNTSEAAIIKKGADKFVELEASTYAEITSKEGLIAAVDAADDMADFRKISVEQSADYNLVIATKNGDKYYIMNITRGEVETGDAAGTKVTISGKAKK
ncbi:hypothetical protein [Persicobacter diffluens]|uniref:DUF4382 domain-containing protein n=1 Tax=Persicobacter diffluens TaxID=981 RepID=A0AAN4VVC7_9BACT|nr:hypothetical protein PEDI_09200 [Persicobacter diffluens]